MVRKSEVRPSRAVAQQEVLPVQPGIADRMPPSASGRDAGRVLRALALIAVAIGLAVLTAAACVLSYSSIHHLATQAGVSPRPARLYPLIFDAVLVVAGCSVLALRGAGLVSKVYSWLCLLVLLGSLAGGGAVHAAAVKVPRRLAGILAAVIPWALVLIGFGLLLALLRYARIRRLAQQMAEHDSVHGADPAAPSELVVIGNTTAPRERAVGPAAMVPGFTRAPAAPGPGALPVVARTGRSPDAPTAPLPTMPTMPAEPAHAQAAHAQAAHIEPAHAEPAHAEAEASHVEAATVEAAKPARAAVRQADLQLRARVPRQPAGQQAQASPVTAPHAPFMPPVKPRPAAEAPAEGGAPESGAPEGDAAGPGGAPEAGGAPGTGTAGTAGTRTAGAAQAERVGDAAGAGNTATGEAAGAGPVTLASASGGTQQTNPRPLAGQPAGAGTTAESVAPQNVTNVTTANVTKANEPTASTAPPDQAAAGPAAAEPGQAPTQPGPIPGAPSAGTPVTATSLNPAPVTDDEDAEPGEPPALRRPRSSPTPPED